MLELARSQEDYCEYCWVHYWNECRQENEHSQKELPEHDPEVPIESVVVIASVDESEFGSDILIWESCSLPPKQDKDQAGEYNTPQYQCWNSQAECPTHVLRRETFDVVVGLEEVFWDIVSVDISAGEKSECAGNDWRLVIIEQDDEGCDHSGWEVFPREFLDFKPNQPEQHWQDRNEYGNISVIKNFMKVAISPL